MILLAVGPPVLGGVLAGWIPIGDFGIGTLLVLAVGIAIPAATVAAGLAIALPIVALVELAKLLARKAKLIK